MRSLSVYAAEPGRGEVRSCRATPESEAAAFTSTDYSGYRDGFTGSLSLQDGRCWEAEAGAEATFAEGIFRQAARPDSCGHRRGRNYRKQIKETFVAAIATLPLEPNPDMAEDVFRAAQQWAVGKKASPQSSDQCRPGDAGAGRSSWEAKPPWT